MDSQEAKRSGSIIWSLVKQDCSGEAFTCLQPILAQPIPFRLLDTIGAASCFVPLTQTIPFLEQIAATRAMGGWPIIGSALQMHLPENLTVCLELARRFIMVGDVWYAVDILGERVPGPAFLSAFDETLTHIDPWRSDPNPWVRRATGVAIHLWAKRRRGTPGTQDQAVQLLSFLEPQFEEHQIDAIKGVGWGLKTLGRYYPTQTADWLHQQLFENKRKPRALMLRKALTYLPEAEKAILFPGEA